MSIHSDIFKLLSYFSRTIFLLSMQICGIMFASGTKIIIYSTSMIFMEDGKVPLPVLSMFGLTLITYSLCAQEMSISLIPKSLKNI